MLANELIGTCEPDYLVYDTKIPIDTKTITLKSGAGVVARGTVIAFAADKPGIEGAPWTGAGSEVANCIICDDVDTGNDAGTSVVAHAYRSGHFARQALILGTGATELSQPAEKQLEDAGIYLSNVVR